METAPLSDLPMHAGRLAVVDVQAIHAKVGAFAVGMRGVDQRQCDEGTAVFRPAGERGQTLQARLSIHDIHHRSTSRPARSNPQPLPRQIAHAPESSRRRRHDGLNGVDEALHEGKRPRAERALRPFRCPKQIGDEGERRAGDVGEKQRRPSGSDDTSMDLSRFETRIDRRVDRDELAIAAEIGEERA